MFVGAGGGVGHPARVRRHRGQDAADRQPEEPVHPAHQLGLVLGQVVVDGDHVDALAGQRVQVRGGGGDQRLALTGLHLGDVPGVQRGATDQLDVEVPLPERPLRRLAHRGKGFRQQCVQALAVGHPGLEPVGLLPQLHVRQAGEVVLKCVDLARKPLQTPQRPPLAGAQELLDDLHHGVSPSSLTLAICG